MNHLTLYFTAGCHLCELAHDLVVQCLKDVPQSAHCLRIIDIADHPDLLERYGILIPVLRNERSGEEIRWPFDASAVATLL